MSCQHETGKNSLCIHCGCVRSHVANCLDFEDRRRVIITPIHNGEANGAWRSWTRVTHRTGGTVTKQERYEPVVGWRSYWLQYRAEHPELEHRWSNKLFYEMYPV